MALAAMVSFGLVVVFTSFSRTQTAQDNVISMQQNLRAALFLMGRELRMAGYKGPNPSATPMAGILDANSDNIRFTYLATDDGIDNDSDGSRDEAGETTTIQYTHYDADGDGINDAIGRNVDSGPRGLVAENIQAVEFYYELDNSGTIVRSTTPTSRSNIRSVRISVLAQTHRTDRNFTNSTTYASASGVSWGPYNDGRRRRLGQTYIHLRNQ
jgi:type IV pilus assembly protein PilW